MDTNKVYLISGPAGVGKSTTAKKLVKRLEKSAYISGDFVSHMHINGREKPWLSKEEHDLIWNNIWSLTNNFLQFGNDVVIDYVTFPEDAKWLYEKLIELKVELKYVVLLTDKETLIKRDNERKLEERMGERSFILLNEFMESCIDPSHIIDTSSHDREDIYDVIKEIVTSSRFVWNMG